MTRRSISFRARGRFQARNNRPSCQIFDEKSFGPRPCSAEHSHKISSENRNVFLAFAKRRDGNRNDIKPVKQIFSKAAARDLVLEILVRRGDHADVDSHCGRRADRLKTLLFKSAKYLRLGLHGHVADLVQEQRAAVSQFKFSFFGFARPGEGTLGVKSSLSISSSGIAAQLTSTNGAFDRLLMK